MAFFGSSRFLARLTTRAASIGDNFFFPTRAAPLLDIHRRCFSRSNSTSSGSPKYTRRRTSVSHAGKQRRVEGQRRSSDVTWMIQYRKVQEYVRDVMKNPDPDSPVPPTPTDIVLRRWLEQQRFRYQLKSKGLPSTLSDTRKELLESLGLSMFPRQDSWDRRYEQLCDFVREHGKFPYDYDVDTLQDDDRKLWEWCRKQKHLYRRYWNSKKDETASVNKEKIAKLNEIGFCWNKHDSVWFTRYNELEQFLSHHGHCLVPSNYPNNPSLATWVGEQRNNFKKFKRGRPSGMNPKRFELLQKLEFEWNANDAAWLAKYRELEDHAILNEKVISPALRKSNRSLFYWVNNQKRYYERKLNGEKTSLTDKRQEMLEKLGFPWI